MRPEMRCLSPRRFDLMPDGTCPTGPGEVAHAAEVLSWLREFADRSNFRFSANVVVLGLQTRGQLRLQTDAGDLDTRRLLVATGEFDRPWIPSLPGVFKGPECHSARLRIDDCQPGEHVVVVGAGNSAAELVGLLLERQVRVTVAARTAPERGASPPGGELSALTALRWHVSALPLRWLPARGGCTDRTPLVDPGLYEAIRAGKVRLVGAALGRIPDGVETADGPVACDRLVWATGFSRSTAWLGPSITRDARGVPLHREGVSTEVPGVGFVGLPCQRTRRSGFMRGFADDARAVLRRLA